jgi:hypothetical protein
MIISVMAIAVGLIIMALPLVGFILHRAKTAPARKAERDGRKYWEAHWIETGEIFLDSKKVKDSDPDPKPEPVRAEPFDPEPVAEPETEDLPTQLGEVTQPAWAISQTQEWSLEDVIDAEVVETETEAERLFYADPLSSWVMPPEAEYNYLPEAHQTFRDLVARNWLTGVGADIETEWPPGTSTKERTHDD